MKKILNALIVEDSVDDAKLLLRELARGGWEVKYARVETGEQMSAELARQEWDIVLCDYALPHFSGDAALNLVKESGCDTPFIFVSATIGEDTAVAAMKAGAHDYVMKGKLARLNPAIERELRDAVTRRQHREAEKQMRMSEHKYRHLFQSMSDAALLIAGGTEKIIDANEQAEILFGRTRGEILGLSTAQLYAPPAVDQGQVSPTEVTCGAPGGCESAVLRRDGTTVPVHVCISRVQLYERPFLLTLFRDISERKHAEAALRNVLRHARTIVMHGSVAAPSGWHQNDGGWSAADFHWEWRFQDEAAAREVLPLEVPPGGTYHQAWEVAKHHDDLALMATVATRAFAAGASSWQQEFRCLDCHRRTHWFTQAASIETLGHGRWLVTTVNTDITERVLAEEALRTSEERLSTVFHLSPTPICIVRAADNRFVDVNEAFMKGTGYTREEFIGRTPTELNLWAVPAERDAIVREVHEKGTAIAFKLHGRRKSGEVGVGLSSMTRIALNGEEHFLWLILDITELERAEEARRESDLRFRQVSENIDEVFWLTDVNKSQIIYVSPAYQCIWGRSCESVYAAPLSWLDTVHPEDRERVEAALRLQATGDYNLEYRIQRPDGAVRWIHERAFPIKDEQGKPYRIAGVAEDITAKRLLEEQLRHAQKMESLGTLAGGIAHDFNNVLTGVLGSAEVVRLNLPEAHPALPWVANIVSAGARARDLVQQILTFSRKHEFTLVPRKIQVDVSEALRLLRTSIPSTVRIESKIDAACPLVVADGSQIHQVVMNLCTNAWQALPESGGLIEVTLGAVQVTPATVTTCPGLTVGEHVLLTVRDNGCGMPPAVVQRIFEPFFTTKGPGRGTGLGLAVVHGIVQSHHGAILVHSAPNEGTCFEVFLPAIAAPAPDPALASATPITSGQHERILLVDDDAVALAALRGQLEHIGYRVVAVSDANVALKLFLLQPSGFDLVLTDYTMPGLSGEALSAKILAARPECPILLMSGFVDPEHIRSARAAGVRDFVRKPIPLPELSRLIARHVRHHPPA